MVILLWLFKSICPALFYSLSMLWTVDTVTTCISYDKTGIPCAQHALRINRVAERSTLDILCVPWHKNWNNVTNLIWVVLYPGVVWAVLSADRKFGMMFLEHSSRLNLTLRGMKADQSVAWSVNCPSFLLWHVGVCWRWIMDRHVFKERIEKSLKRRIRAPLATRVNRSCARQMMDHVCKQRRVLVKLVMVHCSWICLFLRTCLPVTLQQHLQSQSVQ